MPMTKSGKKMMVLAAVCATARRSNPIRSVAAFTTSTPGFGSTARTVSNIKSAFVNPGNVNDGHRLDNLRMFSASTDLSEEQKTELEAKIKAKGDEIRAMKESGADKSTVAPFVEELLALKAELDPSFGSDSKKSGKKKASKPQAPKEKKFIAPTISSADLLPMINTDSDGKVLRRVKTSEATPTDEDVSIKGWVRTVRKQKTLAFVEVNDGSNLSGIQCVLPFDDIDEDSRAGELDFILNI